MPGEKDLNRVIGTGGLAANVVNLSIGASVYVLPAIIGIQLGPAAILGYIFTALMFAAIIICYVETGSRIKTSGGSYAYVEAAFGPFVGFIINWLFFFGWGILADAAVMNLVADSLSILFPALATPLLRAVFFFVLTAIMVLLNVRSAKSSVYFVSLITIIKIIPLLALIIFGIGYIKTENLQWQHLPSLKAFEDGSLILFFAFAGFECSLNVSGEIKDPERTVPRGILFGGIIVLCIYLLTQTVTQGVLGAQLSEYKDAPLAAVAQKIIGSSGATILLIATIISGLGLVSGDVLTSPRLLYAGAKDGLFPKFLGKVHPRFGTPHWAIIIYGLLICIFSVSGGFKQLAVLASGALLIIYLAVVLATIILRKKKKDHAAFKAPGGIIIPIIAIAAILYVLSNLKSDEILSLLVFIATISVIYFIMKKMENKNAKS